MVALWGDSCKHPGQGPGQVMNSGVIPAGDSLSRHQALLLHGGVEAGELLSTVSTLLPKANKTIAKLEIYFCNRELLKMRLYYFHYKHRE